MVNWKKQYKKILKEESTWKKTYDQNGVDYFIEWEYTNLKIFNVDRNFLITKISSYQKKLYTLVKKQTTLKEFVIPFSAHIQSSQIEEDFYGSPCFSTFEKSFKYYQKKLNSEFCALLIISAPIKYIYYTNLKFFSILNELFVRSDISSFYLRRIFKLMQKTMVEAVDSIIAKAALVVEAKMNRFEKTSTTINEVLEIGSEFIYHWSKMMEQICELTLESIDFDAKTNKKTYDSFFTDSTFNNDDFYKQTKTMVMEREFDQAVSFFNLTLNSSYDDFKKSYRKLAKIYHPDVNKDKTTSILMQKLNLYKIILEAYYKNI